jgi:hypothetical protein
VVRRPALMEPLLARYIARSALLSRSVELVSPFVGTAAPIEASVSTVVAPKEIDRRRSWRSFRTLSGRRPRALPVTRTANSSPPSRATRQSPSNAPRTRLATSCSTRSPASWPHMSLTSLKPSRSSRTRAGGRPDLSADSMASTNARRFDRRSGHRSAKPVPGPNGPVTHRHGHHPPPMVKPGGRDGHLIEPGSNLQSCPEGGRKHQPNPRRRTVEGLQAPYSHHSCHAFLRARKRALTGLHYFGDRPDDGFWEDIDVVGPAVSWAAPVNNAGTEQTPLRRSTPGATTSCENPVGPPPLRPDTVVTVVPERQPGGRRPGTTAT